MDETGKRCVKLSKHVQNSSDPFKPVQTSSTQFNTPVKNSSNQFKPKKTS
jgi:hypothetical protein